MEDEELIAAIRSGDRNSLGGLWDRYAHLLFGVGMKYMKNTETAKDLVIEVFSNLPEMLAKHSIERFRPWIHTVMRNRCLIELRKQRPNDPIDDEFPLIGNDHEQELHEFDLQQLEKAIERLDHAQRTCITLFYLHRNSYREVAELTGSTLDKVRSNIQNGRRNLRIILEKNADRKP